VKEHSLREIWFESEGFNRYRGTGWMKEPCSSCEHKERDLGGCRCQAFMLANDPAAADPVCSKSPDHHVVQKALISAHGNTAGNSAGNTAKPVVEHPLVFRDPANSRRLGVTP
jgi:pyrroloquinoline quinone biosynthesis protein E